MKIVVTGGAGFLGQRLIRALCERGRLTCADGVESAIEQIVSIDQAQTGRLFVDDRVGYVIGDIANAVFVNNVLEGDTDTVFHLAALASGTAEAEFDLGMRTNVDGTRAVLESCRRQRGRRGVPKVVFASSVTVFGRDLPAVVTDSTPPLPVTSYGAQKLLGETLLTEYMRKGFVAGRALRLPAIVVRPGEPGLVLSSFVSNVICEALAGREVGCPVAAETALWIASPAAVVAALVHAHDLAGPSWGGRALNLPGLTVTMTEVLDALRAVSGTAAAERVKFAPDAETQRTVATWPARFATTRADALGFERDAGLTEIVRAYAAEQAS